MIHKHVSTGIIISFILFGVIFQPAVASALSIEEERQLGETFLHSVRQTMDLEDDDFVNEYINDLGQYLTKALQTKSFPFNFYIIKASDLNAFAGPGGHIFIYTGLIEVMTELDELASVICHEIGHVSARHISHQIAQNTKISLATMAGILAGALIGGEAAAPLIIGSTAAGIQKQLSYSRTDERQADQLGFQYMEESGFDPACSITAFKKLYQGQWLGTDAMPAYLLTHPGGPERMSNMETMLAGYDSRSAPKNPNANAERFRALYPLFRTVLQAGYLETRNAKRIFQTELEKDPDSPLAHLGLGLTLQHAGEYGESIKHIKIAYKDMPDSIPVMRYLAEAHQFIGEDKEAIQILERVLLLDEPNKPALFLLATSYMNQESFDEAIRIYEKLISMKPVKDEVYHNLGVAYGRQDRLALAHYHFGIYFTVQKESQTARFHFQKALDMAKDDPIMQTRIKKALQEVP
ncbi:MAG: M48 family metalloprotease [Deltaproteobacteria bacterium]|nr:M48 family metalloprotease [Deltaproteobacteria bacterium]